MKNLFKLFLCLAIAGTAFLSCTTDQEEGTAEISFVLVDAPGDYDEVWVNVQAIQVIVDGEAHEFAVENPGSVQLLELTGGNFASLLTEDIPAGQLSQIRLILGEENNTVLLKGETEATPLTTPSAQQSGLKLNVNYDLQPGVTYDFILDFNVHESIVQLGAGQGYILKPVIRVITTAESGAISGIVSPATEATVTATDGDTEITADTDVETGEFLLYGVPEGTYTIVIETAEGELVELPGILVETGVTTPLGTIDL